MIPIRKRKPFGFLQKLRSREMTGEVRNYGSNLRERLFHQLPHRLAFRLSDIAPVSALASGHIFLGFTKCGQFLLSYTHSSDTDDHTLQLVHRYRLHWWLFVPHKQLRKVAEVMLFGDQDLQTNLCEHILIYVCQWPNDLSRILIYGCSLGGEESMGNQTRRIYLTITAVPSLNGCSACYQVATSYEEEDIAERWNSCIRFSCLQHGVTVHSNYEIVQPFPRFIPSVQMKRSGYVVLNAGNFIHVLNVNLEIMNKKPLELEAEQMNFRRPAPKSMEEDGTEAESAFLHPANLDATSSKDSACLSVMDYCAHQSVMNCSFDDEYDNNSIRISSSDMKHCSVDKDKEWEILIASVPKKDDCDNSIKNSDQEKAVASVAKSSGSCEATNATASVSYAGRPANQLLPDYNLAHFSPYHISVDAQDSDDSTVFSHCTDDEGVVYRAEPVSTRKKLPTNTATAGRLSGDSEYEFIDEISESSHEKLSTFRRRRLAEKKYEFTDENSENIPQNYKFFRTKNLISPSTRCRHASMLQSELTVDLDEASRPISVHDNFLSPTSSGASPNDVLRPINQNIASPILSPRDDRWRDAFEKFDKSDLPRWNSRESLSISSPHSNSWKNTDTLGGGSCPGSFKCIVDIERRYIELDDEIVSVITDIEDDELSNATGYHNALPIVVHGSDYTQMHMISNTKAEKLNVAKVLVKQVSLDVEQLCHETAQKLCTESGKKYCFCNDYNVDIIDVCPNTGNVIALASVLMQAGNTKVKAPKNKTFASCGPPSRKVYKASATFLFDVQDKTYRILDSDSLVELNPYSLDCSESKYEGDTPDCEWLRTDRNLVKQMRLNWATPTDYYTSTKIMSNEPLLTGKSLTHIVEGQHLVALILGGAAQE